VQNLNLSVNRFLTDYRMKQFFIESSGQNYELAISQITGHDGRLAFYTMFKPVEYDHIIYMSQFTSSWITAKKVFKEIASQVAANYNIDIEEYPDLHSFLNTI